MKAAIFVEVESVGSLSKANRRNRNLRLNESICQSARARLHVPMIKITVDFDAFRDIITDVMDRTAR